jgi:hypothetical protein
VIIVLITLLLTLATNVSFAVLTMMFFLTAISVGSQPSSSSSSDSPPRYISDPTTWPLPRPERPGYHRMVRAGGKYRPWVKDSVKDR